MPKLSIVSEESTGEDAKQVNRQQSVTSASKGEREAFSVIWHQLAYRVDPRPWHVKVKSRVFPTGEPQESPEDVNPTVANGQANATGERLILDRICGEARSGEMTAILGPSGAGKSTLIHCLFQNRTDGTSGKILVDSCSESKLRICFIPQQDHLNEWLTVREDLMFVSKLKFAGPTDHEANAIRVAELLRLGSCLHVPIKNISGGERKRLSIARELMSKPNILIIDEPTTGLDSLTCRITIQVLRDIVRASAHPMAVVVTVHQPEKKVFDLFDRTYLISTSGRVIYDDEPKRAIQTMNLVGGLRMPSPNHNPASFLIKIASDPQLSGAVKLLADHQEAKFAEKHPSAYLERLVRPKKGSKWSVFSATRGASRVSRPNLSPSVNEAFDMDENGIKFQAVDLKLAKDTQAIQLDESSVGEYYISQQLSDCRSSHQIDSSQTFRHILILTHRAWLSLVRNPTFTRSRLVFHASLPFLMLLVFGMNFAATNNCPVLESEISFDRMLASIQNGSIMDNIGATHSASENVFFYFVLMAGFALNIITVTAAQYPLTMHMFKKEVINGLYSTGPYLVGQTLAELPFELFFPSLSIILTYHISGGAHSFLEWRLFAIVFVYFLVSYVMHTTGLLSGSIFVNNTITAVIAGQLCLLPHALLSGYLVRASHMPDWLLEAAKTSPLRHGMNAVLAARYGFNLCYCDQELLAADGPSLAGMTPQVRNVIDYLFPKTNDTSIIGDSFDGRQVSMSEIFDRLVNQFAKSQTFGRELRLCKDVKPIVMYVFGVVDADLFYSIGWLLLIIIALKVMTFSSIKLFPYRLS